jgi:hexokinase
MLIEKLMSGLYMGENARRILLSFARHASLFNGHVPEKLSQPNSFSTAGASCMQACSDSIGCPKAAAETCCWVVLQLLIALRRADV